MPQDWASTVDKMTIQDVTMPSDKSQSATPTDTAGSVPNPIALARKPVRKKKMRRAEKSDANRRALIKAATAVIGKHGYSGASIGRITERAKLAQGTFYLYFASRQDLFDQLLLQLGEDMHLYLAKRVEGAKDYFDVEERGLRAFFEYVKANPAFFRVLKEAEIHAPSAFHAHEKGAFDRYLQSMQRAKTSGQISGFQGRELELITHILMGARYSIHYGFADTHLGDKGMPDWIVNNYVRFIKGGLAALREEPAPSQATAKRQIASKRKE
jgi:AcrR family transcriptional regulator